jgi:hypothetical protein
LKNRGQNIAWDNNNALYAAQCHSYVKFKKRLIGVLRRMVVTRAEKSRVREG